MTSSLSSVCYVQPVYVEPVVLHDDSRMEGAFERGTGIGKRIFNNGHIWQGNFVSWWLNGEGEHIFPDGTIWKGIFKESKLNGIVLITHPNKETEEALFQDGKMTHKLTKLPTK